MTEQIKNIVDILMTSNSVTYEPNATLITRDSTQEKFFVSDNQGRLTIDYKKLAESLTKAGYGNLTEFVEELKHYKHLVDHDSLNGEKREMVFVSRVEDLLDTFLSKVEQEKYIHDYENFWKDIVENSDGTLNKDQVMRELSDYSMVLDNCTRAYSLMSGGIISKPNTHFEHVERIFNDTYSKNSYIADDLINCVIDKTMSYQEIVQAIKEYFNYDE